MLASVLLTVFLSGCIKKKTEPTPTPKSSVKEVKVFSFLALGSTVTGTINGTTITATLPVGTDLTKLIPTITVSDKATVSPASGVAQDFSKAVTYTVTAENGTTQAYTVTVSIVNNGTVYIGNLNGIFYALDALTGAKKWEFKAGNGIQSTATVVNGIVYFSCLDKKLYALDAVTGAKKWEFLHGMGNAFWAPMVADGLIYFGGDPNFYALDAVTGAKKWEFKGDDAYTFQTSPTVVGGVVYVSLRGTAASIQGVGTFALDAKTGAKLWSKPTGVWVTESSPAVVNNVVYAGSEFDGISAFEVATGTVKWKMAEVSCANSSPTVANGIVYIGSGMFGTNNKKLYALDASTGAKKWDYGIEESTAGYSSPIVMGGIVYIGSGATLYAVDAATGAKKWDAKPEANTLIYSGPVVAASLVYIGIGKKVYAFDATAGTKKWEFASDRTFDQSSPCVVAKDGVVYHAGISGMVQ